MNDNMQIYILLYKEVPLALKINSVYSKRRLLNIHENVRVLRYPDHFSTGVYLWYAFQNINQLKFFLLLLLGIGLLELMMKFFGYCTGPIMKKL